MISSGASCLTSNFRGVYIRFVNIPPFTALQLINISSRARWHNFGLSHRRRRRGWRWRCLRENVIWVFPKIVGFPLQIIHFNRVFHEINHPFWGIPIFGNTHIDSWIFFGWSLRERSLSFFRLPNRTVFLGWVKECGTFHPTGQEELFIASARDKMRKSEGAFPVGSVLKREATKTLRFPCLKKFLARKNGYTWCVKNLRTIENEWMGNYRT